MKHLLFILFLLSGLTSYAQEAKDSVFYRYMLAMPDEHVLSEKCELRYDEGKGVEYIKDEKDKKISFKSDAAALMYLLLQGWELVAENSAMNFSSFQGTGSSDASMYWLLRKPSTREEVQKIVNEAIIKK